MEKKMNMNHHDKHGVRHRPRDPYEIYELEHMLHSVNKVSNNHRAKPQTREKVPSDYFDKGRTAQHNWHSTYDGNESISNETINREAEDFIEMKHKKFELSKWMSVNEC
ncbi:hypothetical protein BUALT_Bualt17G0033300 [Buddleja alternifolia]|uniref:Uncharacterized protein n=1 Tax=Buddleja alternifolia TaxID=168488 RepID=A0AAV6W3Z7_9LAMI|nr:hypothetical protein BUALT_Bualt17G0033300 [Buddleja alternifolia]